MKKNHSLYGKADTYVPLKKIIRKMKLTLLIVLLSVVQIFANSVYSQNTRFSLKQENTTIENVLRVIENQSEYYFLYNGKLVDVTQKVSINTENQDIEKTLNELFRNTDIAFKVYDRQIVLSQSDDVNNMQQQKSVTGKVTDSTGGSLPGVSVVVKGTTTGTITDFDGNYTLPNVPANAILQFSFVGMKSQEIAVGSKTAINVTMVEESIGLEEVVAVGYGTVKKSDLTGSVTSVKREDLNKGAITSVDQALQGRIAGVQISQTSSEPGGGLSIRVRGASSVNAGNEPLYVIDGLPIDNSGGLAASATGVEVSTNMNVSNPLNALNPNDILSIEVLKDASATAIYGSRGANGVVLITTRKGSDGAIKLSYDGYSGIQTRAKKIDVLSTSEYIKYMNEIYQEQGLSPRFSNTDITGIGAGVDWQNEIFTPALMQSHNLNLSGGTKKTKYYASMNYFDQDGVVKETGTKRYILRLNLDQEIGEKAKFGINLNNSKEYSDNYIGGINTNENAGPVYCALFYDPTEPIYGTDGRYSESSELTINHPLATIYGISSKSETSRMFGNLTFDYKLTSALSAKLNVGFDNQTTRRDIYNSTQTTRGKAAKGYANVSSLDRSNLLAEYTMNYSKTFANKQSLNILGGITYQDFVRKSFSAGTSGFPSDNLGTDNLALGNPSKASVASTKEGNTLLSYLFRTNYSFHNFLLTASVRADGSSRFGVNNKYGYFPSFAFGWKLSDESFIPEFFNTLKLRTSWGITGNQEIGNYLSLTTYNSGGTAILDRNTYTGTVPSRLSNPDLKWESTTQANVGLDFGILSGRISGSVDYFNKKTSDMLLDMPLPTSSGYASVTRNVGSMKNYGLEILINSTNITKGKFSWKSSLNFSAIRNEVISLGGLSLIQRGFMQVINGNATIIKPGSPVDSYYGYKVLGLFHDQSEINSWVQPTAKPGYPKYQDVNGDKQITTADQQIIGNPFPDFTFGINNTLTYKNLELSFFFQGQSGADLLNSNAIESLYPANATRNRFAYQVADRWTPTNLEAKYPTPINFSAWGGSKVTNLVVEDASYIRLKTLQLGYNIPTKLWGIQSAKVYVTGQNLFTLTNYTGYDPESNAYGQSNVKIDYSSYPLVKTWMIGLNVQF